ncbi:50S ribosomal protein L14e [Candidatus Micrarchaeota archaeon]|nr:50S ribosomal protein L14e [Candidatus Micrarchaeota archaeon]
MALIEKGRVCLKKRGRDAGSKCVITNKIDDSYVEIRSAGRKKPRKCNVSHLEPLSIVVNVESEEEVKKALEK